MFLYSSWKELDIDDWQCKMGEDWDEQENYVDFLKS